MITNDFLNADPNQRLTEAHAGLGRASIAVDPCKSVAWIRPLGDIYPVQWELGVSEKLSSCRVNVSAAYFQFISKYLCVTQRMKDELMRSVYVAASDLLREERAAASK